MERYNNNCWKRNTEAKYRSECQCFNNFSCTTCVTDSKACFWDNFRCVPHSSLDTVDSKSSCPNYKHDSYGGPVTAIIFGEKSLLWGHVNWIFETWTLGLIVAICLVVFLCRRRSRMKREAQMREMMTNPTVIGVKPTAYPQPTMVPQPAYAVNQQPPQPFYPQPMQPPQPFHQQPLQPQQAFHSQPMQPSQAFHPQPMYNPECVAVAPGYEQSTVVEGQTNMEHTSNAFVGQA